MSNRAGLTIRAVFGPRTASRGTKEEVAQAVKAAIESVGRDGRLIICSSNSLHPGVDPANCIAMFEATNAEAPPPQVRQPA